MSIHDDEKKISNVTKELGFCIIGGILLCVLGLALYQAWLQGRHDKDALEILKNLATVFGGVIGGGYVVFKLCTGWLTVNLGISLEQERIAFDESKDYLKVRVMLAKGPTDSLWLEALSVEFFESRGVDDQIPITAMIQNDKLQRTDGKLICFAPNETAEFATYAVVPASAVVHIKVVVQCDRLFYDFPFNIESKRRRKLVESHSTAISLPNRPLMQVQENKGDGPSSG